MQTTVRADAGTIVELYGFRVTQQNWLRAKSGVIHECNTKSAVREGAADWRFSRIPPRDACLETPN